MGATTMQDVLPERARETAESRDATSDASKRERARPMDYDHGEPELEPRGGGIAAAWLVVCALIAGLMVASLA
jgi:hypothetical protein